MRLLPYLYAYSVSYFVRTYDAICSFVSTYETTYKTTNSYGRDANSTAVLRAQQSTFLIPTFSPTDRRLSHACANAVPQRRRRSVR